MQNLSINHWAEADRPREKLEKLGASALSDAELLAILIGSGTPNESAVGLMKRILNGCNNNLNTLGKLSLSDLKQYKGIGPAKAITILAACELGKRRQRAAIEESPILNSSEGIYNYMRTTIQDLDVEEGWMLMLKQNFRLIEAKRISDERGTHEKHNSTGFLPQSSQWKYPAKQRGRLTHIPYTEGM